MTTPRIILINVGLKTCGGKLPSAQFYLDCRGLPDAAGTILKTGFLRGGVSVPTQEWVEDQIDLPAYLTVVIDAITRFPARRRVADPWRDPFVICCFCAWGMHRSKAMKFLLARDLRAYAAGMNLAWEVKVSDGLTPHTAGVHQVLVPDVFGEDEE